MGWLPSIQRRWLCMLRLWNKLVSLDNTRLTRKLFDFDYSNADLVGNWCSEIREVFQRIDLSELYIHKMHADTNDVKNRLINFHAISWPEKLNYSPKLRTYKIIKNIYETAKTMLK